MAQNSSKNARWCKLSSTYRWELFLNNGYEFHGYSNKEGNSENQDKQALLQGCISRLMNHGYGEKCYLMRFYKREFNNKKEDELILELYAEQYVAHGQAVLDLQTINFLDNIYRAKLSGKGLDYRELRPSRPKRPADKLTKDAVDFQFSLSRFPTRQDFINHCHKLIEVDQYPRSRVEGHWKDYQHAYPNNQPPKTSPVVRPASVNVEDMPPIDDKDNAQMRQNALNTVAAIQGRMNATPNMRRQ